MTSIRSKSLFDIYLKFKKNRGGKKKEKKKYEATFRSKGDGRKIGLDDRWSLIKRSGESKANRGGHHGSPWTFDTFEVFPEICPPIRRSRLEILSSTGVSGSLASREWAE